MGKQDTSEWDSWTSIVGTLILVAVLLNWTSSKQPPQTDNGTISSGGISASAPRDCSQLEPENPYGMGSGHYRGFEWAEEREVSSCGGNSQSFIEGCEEYLEQADAFAACEDAH